ncbi:hypothetical protein ACK9YZ_08600 [Rhizobium sp. ZK1]|uniref:hypothetical protein n=1 Tax=Rhizobium sp. ZK1 TaxID=3389872 RepID=UPI0039F66C2E
MRTQRVERPLFARIGERRSMDDLCPGSIVQNFTVRSDEETVSRQSPVLKQNSFLTLTPRIWHEIRKVEGEGAKTARQ